MSGSLSDYGINDRFIKDLSAKLRPNSSALFVLVRKSTPDKVLPEVSKYGGTVLHTSLSNDEEARLQAALGVRPRERGAVRPGLSIERYSHVGHPRSQLVGHRPAWPVRRGVRGERRSSGRA